MLHLKKVGLRIFEILPAVQPSPRGEYELQDGIQGLIDGGANVVGVAADERLQVSSPADLLALTRRLLGGGSETRRTDPESVGAGTRFVDPVRIEPEAVIGGECEIGPEAFLEGGCHIGEGAIVRRSIVLRGGCVPADPGGGAGRR